MGFLRVSNPAASPYSILDLGITIGASASNVPLSDQFSVNDLYLSADLESAIIGGFLTVQIDYGTGFTSVAAIDYTNRDTISAFLNIYEITNENNNEKLVNGSDASSLHIHDSSYYTKTQLNSTGGAAFIGTNPAGWSYVSGANVQLALNSIDALFSTAVTLDTAYTNDGDGVMNVNGGSKPLDLRSNGSNDLILSRKIGTDYQKALQFAVAANEVILGAASVGALSQVNVHIPTNLIIDGNLTVTGTVTDTTVNELNVTNANIKLRSGAEAIAQADASLEVVRGTTGADAQLRWDSASNRFKAGIIGGQGTIALLEFMEVVTGVWEFQGPASTAPSMYLTNKSAAPSTNLGSGSQIPVAMVNNTPAYDDKSNSRNKFLSMYRRYLNFSGRDNPNNRDEYLRAGLFTSNQSSYRCIKPMTLIGISAQFELSATANIRVRKNSSVTNLATLAVSAAVGAQDATLNLDFAAGDVIQVYLDSSGVSISRPFVSLELAEKL